MHLFVSYRLKISDRNDVLKRNSLVISSSIFWLISLRNSFIFSFSTIKQANTWPLDSQRSSIWRSVWCASSSRQLRKDLFVHRTGWHSTVLSVSFSSLQRWLLARAWQWWNIWSNFKMHIYCFLSFLELDSPSIHSFSLYEKKRRLDTVNMNIHQNVAWVAFGMTWGMHIWWQNCHCWVNYFFSHAFVCKLVVKDRRKVHPQTHFPQHPLTWHLFENVFTSQPMGGEEKSTKDDMGRRQDGWREEKIMQGWKTSCLSSPLSR